MNRFVVAGAPCAGKSSYVRANAQRGDLIVDYDTLHQALSGLPSHEHLAALRPYVMAARDALLAELAARKQQPAWVITSTRSQAELTALAERLDAEIMFLEVEPAEAHRRCTEVGRPEEWHGYIDNWFAEADISAPAKSWRATMKTKTFRAPIELKADGQAGEFTAIFSRFNVVDHDGDVTVPGAFRDGQAVRISYWGHRWQDLPVGRGVVHQDEEKAWVDGRFFLQTQAGKETYETVKALGELQEWSYGFDVEEAEPGVFAGENVVFLRRLNVHEVSPVMLGAGIGTGTTAIKEKKRAIPSHSTPTTDAAWDGPGNAARLSNEAGAATYRKMFAWVDPDGDPDAKGSYKFPHHVVSEDGAVGAANVRACSAGIAALNGGRGGVAIPDADRQGVWNHLARHLRDADMEPPALKSLDDGYAQGDGEGEGIQEDAKPSGVSPDVITVQIELIELEAD